MFKIGFIIRDHEDYWLIVKDEDYDVSGDDRNLDRASTYSTDVLITDVFCEEYV